MFVLRVEITSIPLLFCGMDLDMLAEDSFKEVRLW